MSFQPTNISTIQDLQSLAVYGGSNAQYNISNALLNSTGTTIPTSYWYPTQIPASNLYTISFNPGFINPSDFRIWATSDYTNSNPNDPSYLPSSIRLTVGNVSTFVDSAPTWLPYYVGGNIGNQYGYVYANAATPGTSQYFGISSYTLAYNYNDGGSGDSNAYSVRLLNLSFNQYVPPPPPPPDYIKEPLPLSCGCGPKPKGPGAVPESIYLAKKIRNCTVTTPAMARALVNSQLRGVASSVRTVNLQFNTLECYAPITDPIRRQALYQGPIIPPACPPTPAEQLNSTMPKPSNGGNCLQAVPFYQRPPQ